MRSTRFVGAAALLACALACGPKGDDEDPAYRQVLLASTTSVDDTGLLDTLAVAFRADHPDVHLRVIAVGSGHALELGRRGDADVLLVHDPAAESAFVAAGHAPARRTIMHNDFVIVGPPADPARVRAARATDDALRRIADARAPFVSRGDSSGTHRRELALWQNAGVRPHGDWYLEAGIGQGDMLRMASERGAYAAVDRGTYRFLRSHLELEIVHEDGVAMANPYSVLVPVRGPNAAGARVLADWLTGPRAAGVIAAYGATRFGSPLFTPAGR